MLKINKKQDSLISNFKLYAKTPKFAASFTLLLLAGSITVGLFFLAPLFYAVINLVVFVGIAIVTIYNQINLAIFGAIADEKTNELNAVIENTEDGIIIYDLDFKILALNGGAEKILGIKKEETMGQKITPDFMNRPGLKLLTQVLFPSLALSAVQISQENWPQIVEILTDEPALKLKTTLNRIINGAGEAVGFLKIVSDETREKKIIQSKS